MTDLTGKSISWSRLVKGALVRAKRTLFFERPFFMKRLGQSSFVEHPRVLRGRACISIGDRTMILAHAFLMAVDRYLNERYAPLISVGNNVYIGRYVYITSIDRITIHDGSVLSEHVYITDLNHGFNPECGRIMNQPLESKGPVEIGANCFLGYRVTVMPGVQLGEWCIVGANSVVTHSFPAYSMIAGSPARLVKRYSHQLRAWVAADSIKTEETN